MPLMLIADDHRQITSVLEQYAAKEGYEVMVAGDGRQALDLFSTRHPDVILLDVMMPVVDGFEVCREIRKTSSAPVIMITARGEDFERIMGLDIGADDYIVKPFSPGEVMARLRAALRRIGMQRSDSAQTLVRGNLTVRLLWQFQSGDPDAPTATTARLFGPSVLRRVDGATGKAFVLESALVWPALDAAGRPVNPGTPRDMHNKFVLLDVPGHETGRRLYVSSSNLDTPGQGSGRLWQAGTIVAARPGSGLWSGKNAHARQLWGAYKHYFELLWASREGQPGAGQAAFHEAISRERLAGQVNWIETTPDGAPPSGAPRPGIDAFFFPVPLYR